LRGLYRSTAAVRRCNGAWDEICAEASAAIAAGARILVLSTATPTPRTRRVPSLLQTVGRAPPPGPGEDPDPGSASSSRPVRPRGAPRRVLIGYGAPAVKPYLRWRRRGPGPARGLHSVAPGEAWRNLVKASARACSR
jgi:glutamate synthase (NADPH/NADH) large chain